jgi:hypothetical protein
MDVKDIGYVVEEPEVGSIKDGGFLDQLCDCQLLKYVLLHGVHAVT